MRRRRTAAAFLLLACLLLVRAPGLQAQSGGAGAIPAPEPFLGFPVGADNKLARWDRIVDYMQRGRRRLTAGEGAGTRQDDAGQSVHHGRDQRRRTPSRRSTASSSSSASSTSRAARPRPRERDEIFRSGKAVVLITCNLHSTEIGASQMALELVHRLATEDSPVVRKILDNVILRARAERQPRRPDHGRRLVQQEPRARNSSRARCRSSTIRTSGTTTTATCTC